MFHGSTAFKPRDWAFRVTPAFNLNYVEHQRAQRHQHHAGGRQEPPPQDLALQEAFGEVKLFDVGANYDFMSVRAGIQPFNSDFRGFLFRDTNLGVRVFGNWGRNRNQWNVAYFDQLEKETNSELNLDRAAQPAGLHRQLLPAGLPDAGYTISPSFHANIDKGEEFFFDANGFLVRPSPIGLIRPHEVKAYYVGVGGDGHIGPHEHHAPVLPGVRRGRRSTASPGQAVDINAQFAAVEVSIDKDWCRPRIGFILASGDSDPDDDRRRRASTRSSTTRTSPAGRSASGIARGCASRDGRRPRRPEQRAAVAAQQQDRGTGELRQPRPARCSTPASTPS